MCTVSHPITGAEIAELESRMARSADALLKVLKSAKVRAALKVSKAANSSG